MNIDASPSSWHSPPWVPGLEPWLGDVGVAEGYEDVCADVTADVTNMEAEVSAGNDVWECRIMVANSAGRCRRVSVDIVSNCPLSDDDMPG